VWGVECTDEFGDWWNSLTEPAQESIAHDVEVLRTVGPMLGRPWGDTVQGSRTHNMKGLRTQHQGSAYRSLSALDPRRTAILLIGGKKTGDRRWYDRFIPVADRLYEEHLETLRREGLI
jgi:hypothetical protein